MTINSFHKTVWEKRSKQIAILRDDGVCVYSEPRKKARCAAYLFSNLILIWSYTVGYAYAVTNLGTFLFLVLRQRG